MHEARATVLMILMYEPGADVADLCRRTFERRARMGFSDPNDAAELLSRELSAARRGALASDGG